jgi:hypothetical protein
MAKQTLALGGKDVGGGPGAKGRGSRCRPLMLLLLWVVTGATAVTTTAAGVGAAATDHVAATPQVKLFASDGVAGDWFGTSMAVSGDTLVVGAPGDDDRGSSSGSIYVFVRTGSAWSQQAKLTAADGAAGDRFGGAVAISGDTLVVGADSDGDVGTDSGSVYVFVRDGGVWTQQAKLTAADGAQYDHFGSSVTISGNTVVVGAPWDQDHGWYSGSAYVFARTGTLWSQQAKLTADDAEAKDWFGSSVAISGSTLFVGAEGDDHGDWHYGSVYVFGRSGSNWTQQAKLIPAHAEAHDSFGSSMAISGDTLVVGAMNGFYASGSAYVFVQAGDSWIQQAKLNAYDLTPDYYFGTSVAINGDTAVVGTPGDDESEGRAFVFFRTGNSWTLRSKIIAADVDLLDYFGKSVTIIDNTVMVGSPGDGDRGHFSGSAYMFRLSDPPLADAGPDQVVRSGARVKLSAVNSRDRDSKIISYLWKQLGRNGRDWGPRVQLIHPQAKQASFVAPDVTKDQTLAFEVSVIDRGGLLVTDRCLVTVTSNDRTPVAKAGPPQTVAPGARITLNGRKSRNPGDGALNFRWEQLSGPPVALAGALTARATFAAPTVDQGGASLGFRLLVTNADNLKAEDTTLVNVSADNQPPKSRAGKKQTAIGGTLVQLDGSASSDPDDGIASYRWEQLSGPPVKLSNPLGQRPTFRSPKVGPREKTLLFRLTVTDQGGLQSQSRSQVRVTGSR